MRTWPGFLAPLLAVSIALAAPVSDSEIERSGGVTVSAQKLDGSSGGVRAQGAVSFRRQSDRPNLPSAAETTPGDGVAEPAAPAAFLPFKLSGGGPVDKFGISPDGLTAVWIETVAGVDQLYSRPVDGSVPAAHLSAGLFGSGNDGVTDFDFSPDNSTVVFTADFLLSPGIDSLASVPIGGGSTITLNRPMVDEPITGFGISPNSLLVYYFGIDVLHGSDRTEVNTNSIFGGTPTQLSGAGLAVYGHADVDFAGFTPDSASVVHAADITALGVLDLFAGPATGYFNSTLSSAKGTATWAQIGSTRVTYISDDEILGVQEVYSVLIDGTGKLKLNSSMAGSAVDLEVSLDGMRTLYRADQDSLGVLEGYSALVDTPASSAKVHNTLVSPRFVDSLDFTPDSASVLYRSDELEVGVTELFVRPIDLSAPSTLLHDSTAGEIVGLFIDRGVPILNRRAIYPVFGVTVDLFTVATDGTEPPVKLNDPLGAGDALFDSYVSYVQTARLIAYGAGPTATGVTNKVYTTPIRKDLPVEQFNLTAGPGDLGVDNYVISAAENHVVYKQDQDTQGKLELYSTELDSDGDGTGNATDNCRFVANAGGIPVELPWIDAVGKSRFGWANRQEVRFAHGDLPVDGSYTTTSTGSLRDANFYVESATPAVGEGTWTLIAPDCAARDWGNSGRNAALP